MLFSLYVFLRWAGWGVRERSTQHTHKTALCFRPLSLSSGFYHSSVLVALFVVEFLAYVSPQLLPFLQVLVGLCQQLAPADQR